MTCKCNPDCSCVQKPHDDDPIESLILSAVMVVGVPLWVWLLLGSGWFH